MRDFFRSQLCCIGLVLVGVLLFGQSASLADVIASNLPATPGGTSISFFTSTAFDVGFTVGNTDEVLDSVTLPLLVATTFQASDFSAAILDNQVSGGNDVPGTGLVTILNPTAVGSDLVLTASSPTALSANQTYWLSVAPTTPSASDPVTTGQWSGFWTFTNGVWVWTWVFVPAPASSPSGQEIGQWSLGTTGAGTMVEPVAYQSTFDGTTFGALAAASDLPAISVEGTAVPEPGMIGVLGIGSLGLLMRRRFA